MELCDLHAAPVVVAHRCPASLPAPKRRHSLMRAAPRQLLPTLQHCQWSLRAPHRVAPASILGGAVALLQRARQFRGPRRHSWRFLGAVVSRALAAQAPAEAESEQKEVRPPEIPCEEGSTVTLRIDDLMVDGRGVGRFGDSRWVIMAFGALPGELAEVQITRNYRSYSEAVLLNVVEASKDRVQPKCPIFERCSGCQYQHLAYDAQLKWKRQHVLHALRTIAKIDIEEDMVRPTLPSPRQYHYRTKMTPHMPLAPPARRKRLHYQLSVDRPSAEEAPIGFLEEKWGEERDYTGRRWKEVVDVEQCPIATEAINEALPARRALARSRGYPTIFFRDTTVEGVTMDLKRFVIEEVPGVGIFKFRAGGFFQNNSSILPSFVDLVIKEASAPFKADGSAPVMLVDLYCGVGLFAIAGSKRFPEVIGIEVVPVSVRMARRNAYANGAENVSFVAADAGAGVRHVLRREDVVPEQMAVVTDPPRSGMTRETRESLIKLRARRLVYVSCDCGTQARDLKLLIKGGYQVCSVTPCDLFPQTRHVEVVVVLEFVGESGNESTGAASVEQIDQSM